MTLRLISIIILGILIIFPIAAESLSPSDHLFNPALLSISSRSFLEFGFNVNASLSNNYLSSSDIFTEEIIINFQEMYEELYDTGFQITTRDIIENHLLFSIASISAGLYMTIDGLASLTIPGDFIDLVAHGNEIDETYTGSSDLYCHLFAETGLYAGYKWRNFQFGTKLGIFSPIAYCDNGIVEYNLLTNSSTGMTSATASFDAKIFSAINFEAESSLSFTEILGTLNGLNIDLGALYMDGDTVIGGVHLNNIPIKPAYVENENSVSFSATGTINNPLDSFDDEEEEMMTEDSEFDVANAAAGEEISMPIELGAFYRMTFIPVIDILFKGELVFADLFMFSLGTAVEADFSPFPSVFYGIGYNRTAWEMYLGTRMDVRFFEIGLDFCLTAPDFPSMFTAEGFSAELFLAFGY
jgi:hypothetical protein